MNGSSQTILAIGQSGTGKSYTLSFGRVKYVEKLFESLNMPDWAGIVPRLLSKIFADKGANTIQLSIVQVFCSKAQDLLNKNQIVVVRQLEKSNEFRSDETRVKVSSYKEAIQVFNEGINQRNVSETRMNSASSRSHAILKIILSDYSGKFLSEFTIADLAGTESRKITDRTSNKYFGNT